MNYEFTAYFVIDSNFHLSDAAILELKWRCLQIAHVRIPADKANDDTFRHLSDEYWE